MMYRSSLVLLCISFGRSTDAADTNGQLASIRAELAKAEAEEDSSSQSAASAKSKTSHQAQHSQERAVQVKAQHQAEQSRSQDTSQSQSGDYQQHMKSSGSQYQEYMKKYGSSKQYQTYMNKYGGNQAGTAGEYQKYVKKYAGSKGQDYVKKYGGEKQASQSRNYERYMEKYSGGSQWQGGSDSHSTYYGKYLQKYASGDHGAAAGQSGDYQKFMQKYGDKAPSGDYQQYMELGAGGRNAQGDGEAHASYYKQYLQNYGHGSKSGNYQQYVQKYSGGKQSQAESGDYQQYIQKYVGGSQRGSSSVMELYAAPKSSAGEKELSSARDAKNRNQLDSWKTHEDLNVKKYVPNEYQHYAFADVEKDYAERLHQLENDTAAHSTLDLYAVAPSESGIYLFSAKDAKNSHQLESWRTHEDQKVKKYVPSEYRHYAFADIKKDYTTRLQQLKNETGATATLDLYAVPNQRSAPTGTVIELFTAEDAKNSHQLDSWKTHEDEKVKKYVPSGYQHYAFADIKQEYTKRLHQLENETAAPANLDLYAVPNQRSAPTDTVIELFDAKDARNVHQLDSWKTHEDDKVKRYVPSGYQHYAFTDVKKDYTKRLHELKNDTEVPATLDLYAVPNQRSAPTDTVIELFDAKDARNEHQLNSWKTHEDDTVKKYVPSGYQHYAFADIKKDYTKRLHELENDTAMPAILDLYAVPHHKAHEQTQDELREAAEAGASKAERMGESLRRAANNTEKIENLAAKPAKEVNAAFSKRTKELEQDVRNLQVQAKSQQTGADFEAHLDQSMHEVKSLHDEEMHALARNHRDAKNAARHAARGTQAQIRKEARQVEAMSDNLARKNTSYERLQDQLGNRVEAAADVVERYSEELARRTQDHLEVNLEKSQEAVHQSAHRQLRALQDAKATAAMNTKASKESEHATVGFLAARSNELQYGFISPVASMALLGVACSCVAFFATRNTRRVVLSDNLLG
jgi:hypothetical protein